MTRRRSGRPVDGDRSRTTRGRARAGRLLAPVVVAVTASGCLDAGLPDLRTAPVERRLDELVTALAPSSPGSTTSLDECPVDDVAGLLDDTLALVDDPPVLAAIAGTPRHVVTSVADAFPAALICTIGSTDGAASIVIAPAPASVDERLEEMRVRYGPAFSAEESRTYRGGRFQRICSDPVDDGAGDVSVVERCEVAWLDDRMAISVGIEGAGARDVRLGDVQERFVYILPVVVDRFIES